MARKEVTFTAEADRDAGKEFQIREMSATAAEWWATRAFLALARSGVEIPDNISSAGLAGIAALGFRALGGADPALVKPLLDEMMSCVQVIPDPAKPMVVRRLVDDDIEEVDTLIKLRIEIFNLHTAFFRNGAPSKPI